MKLLNTMSYICFKKNLHNLPSATTTKKLLQQFSSNEEGNSVDTLEI